MIHTYNITGMTCDGCRAKVEKTLNTIEGIEAKVSLNPPVATITMEKHIPTEKLQEALIAVGKYTIEMSNCKTKEHSKTNEASGKSCCSMHSNNHNKETVELKDIYVFPKLKKYDDVEIAQKYDSENLTTVIFS